MLTEPKIWPVAVQCSCFPHAVFFAWSIRIIFIHIIDTIGVVSRSFFDGSVDGTPNFCAIGSQLPPSENCP